jgi:hypothetical protein
VTSPTPSCPRCGYDLSGAIAAWPRDSCPVSGICSECGLRILWRDVLNPVYAANNLFFETVRRGYARAFFNTWWRAIRPWRLWAWAQMQFPLHPRRLAVFAVLTLGLEWVIGSLSLFAILMVSMRGWGPYLSTAREILPVAIWPVCSGESSWPHVDDCFPPWIISTLTWILLTPFAFRLVPQTLRKAKVRRIHIVRVAAYSLLGLPLLVYSVALIHLGLMRFGLGVWDRDWTNSLWLHLALCGAWLFACWQSAAKHYLRLEHPRAVAAALITLSGLLVITVAVIAACVSRNALSWMMLDLV